jgi:phosphopantothenoylcysteine decarboxylase/phosphopantothenate--cysteine ligase
LDAAPFTVGFAAETENVIKYARSKLKKKKLDMIIANQVGRDCGFDYDDNAVTALWRDGEKAYPKSSKIDLARKLIELLVERFYAASTSKVKPKLAIISNKN